MRAALVLAQAVAERRAEMVRARIAAVAEDVPGVAVAVEGDAVVLSGRGLTRRTIVDPRLQDIARWGR